MRAILLAVVLFIAGCSTENATHTKVVSINQVAVEKAFQKFETDDPHVAAQKMYDAGDYVFIEYCDYSIYRPGDFKLGADLIFAKFKTITFPTSDTPNSEAESKVFAKAYTFARLFNSTMFYNLVKDGKLSPLEIEYKVTEDAKIEVHYDTSTLSLRDKRGAVRVIWVLKSDQIQVLEGKIEKVREGPLSVEKLLRDTMAKWES